MEDYVVFVAVTAIKLLLIPCYHSTDFEVHRNWLALTHSLPYKEWYFEKTSEWTLDYPPFFAWFEYALSHVARLFDPQMLVISNLNHASFYTILFQRLSVIVSDGVLFYAIIHYIGGPKYSEFPPENRADAKRRRFILLLLVFSNPGLIIVDHIHFQYNGFLMGLFVLCLSFMRRGQDMRAGITYAVILNFKHIFIYSAPVFFVYLLRHYCFESIEYEFEGWEQFGDTLEKERKQARQRFTPLNFVKLGLAVISVFALSLGPFLDQLPQLFSRLFPFNNRGLTHAYWAPNAWALYNTADKAASMARRLLTGNGVVEASMTGGLVENQTHAVLPSITPSITVLLTLFCMGPMLVVIWKHSHARLFTPVIVSCQLCSFIFGWHVHEKAILMATIPLSLCMFNSILEARSFLILSTIGNFTLFPLLFQCTETPLKVMLLGFHSVMCFTLLQAEHKKIQKARRINWGGLLSKFDIVYLLFCLVIQGFVSLQPILFPKWVFLPLMVVSVYSSFAVFYVWLLVSNQCHRIVNFIIED